MKQLHATLLRQRLITVVGKHYNILLYCIVLLIAFDKLIYYSYQLILENIYSNQNIALVKDAKPNNLTIFAKVKTSMMLSF